METIVKQRAEKSWKALNTASPDMIRSLNSFPPPIKGLLVKLMREIYTVGYSAGWQDRTGSE